MALPSLTKTIDDYFLSTWYEIRPEAIDNILKATPVWAALKAAGCMTSQVGGEYITRTVKYATSGVTKEIAKGDTLGQGEPELETMAMWTWRYLSTHVQRSLLDDQKNNGKFKIKSLVQTRLQDANDTLVQKYETEALKAIVTDETGKGIQGLNDLLPSYANRATGTYGKISRSNTWWQANYKQLTTPIAVNLVSDMNNLYNTCYNGQTPPNLILTTQALYETYSDFALDMSQIVKDTGGQLVDLGFEVQRFRGKPMIWSPNVTAGDMMFLNTKFIEVVYDPNLWFDMTEWKVLPLQTERIAHIICACNIVGAQPRRHGLLYT